MRRYSDVLQTQLHLKRSPACLLHCLHSFRRLTLAEIRTAEAPAREAVKAIKKGRWQAYQAKGPPRRVPIAFGPRIPTGQERAAGLQEPVRCHEDIPLSEFRQPFQPTAAHTVWVQDFIDGRSKEGARASKLSRPFHREVSARNFGTRLPVPQHEA